MARHAGTFVEPFLVTDGDKFNLKSHDPGRTRIVRRRGPHGGGRNELVGAVTATATLTLVVGAALVAARLLKLGFVANFISTPVLTGFKAGIGRSMSPPAACSSLGCDRPVTNAQAIRPSKWTEARLERRPRGGLVDQTAQLGKDR